MSAIVLDKSRCSVFNIFNVCHSKYAKMSLVLLIKVLLIKEKVRSPVLTSCYFFFTFPFFTYILQ